MIITYYWPPSGGGGVQRWLKFAKYLPEFGWEPIIFTPENPDFDQKDESLLKDIPPDIEVLKFPIWEPYGIFKKLSGRKELRQGQVLDEGKTTFFGKLAIWVRGNLFIPDPRKFWVKPSVEYLDSILKTNEIKTIITTGPPHSVHLIGLNLRMKNPSISWVADFRDPWSSWDILDKLRLSSWARRQHRKLESNVFKVSTKVLTVSESWKEGFKSLGARNVEVITNGYDADDIPEPRETSDEKFRVCHAGMLNELRNPTSLWQVLADLTEEDPQFKSSLRISLVGILSRGVTEFIRGVMGGNENLELEGYVAHEEVFSRYNDSAVLLLILNDSKNASGHLPGKLFEYMALGKPILAIGDTNGDAARIIKEYNLGEIANPNDSKAIKSCIQSIYAKWKNGDVSDSKPTDHFDRRNLTAKLARLLNEL